MQEQHTSHYHQTQVDVPKSEYQLQRQREREMPPIAPDQIPAVGRTESSNKCSQQCGSGKTEATKEHAAAGINTRSESNRDPAIRDAAEESVRTSMGGPAIIKAATEEGRRPSINKGVPVPITQEDEVPNATNRWQNDGAALDDRAQTQHQTTNSLLSANCHENKTAWVQYR